MSLRPIAEVCRQCDVRLAECVAVKDRSMEHTHKALMQRCWVYDLVYRSIEAQVLEGFENQKRRTKNPQFLRGPWIVDVGNKRFRIRRRLGVVD